MTRSRPNTFQALLVYSLLQAAVSLIHINARYDFFVFLTSDGLVRLGECFLSRGHHECIQEILGYFLSILGGRRVSGWHLVRKKPRLGWSVRLQLLCGRRVCAGSFCIGRVCSRHICRWHFRSRSVLDRYLLIPTPDQIELAMYGNDVMDLTSSGLRSI